MQHSSGAALCTLRAASALPHGAEETWDLSWPCPWPPESVPLHHLPFPIPVSVPVAPGEQQETHHVLKEIDDEQINEEMPAWAHEAELEADAHPLPTTQEEPQEEESR